MATVEFRYDPKSTAWFTANAAMVLKAGEPAYHDTTGLFKLGDGVTALSALSFLPIVSASTPTIQQVLTAGQVATTTIETTGFIKTGGLSTQFLKANGSVDSSTYITSSALSPYLTSATAALTYQPIGSYLTTISGLNISLLNNDSGYITSVGTAATSLTTTGSSGAATLIANVLNVPNYTLAGLGGTTLAAVNAQNLSVFAATTSSQLAGVISDETGSGALVFGTSPTFTTGITTPLINGTSGTLQIGTTDLVNIGNATTTSQRLVRIGQNTAWIDIGSQSGSTARPAIYLNTTTPDTTNYALSCHQTTGNTYLNGKSGTQILVNGGIVTTYSTNQVSFAVNAAGGSTINYQFTVPNNTALTASTEVPIFKIIGGNNTWPTGAITNQRWSWITANTANFSAASIITNSYGLYVEAATAGTNATITNNYAAGFNGNVNVIGSLYSTGFRLVDGAQGLNKVLVSDANGNASWATSSTGYGRSVNNIAINTTGAAAANTDYYYFCTTTLTFTLPTAVGNTNTYYIKVTSGTLTINTTSSQTIDGSLTIVTSVANTAFTLISNGTNWQII